MNYSDDVENIRRMSWDDVAERDGEETETIKYKKNIENAVKGQKTQTNSNKNRRKTSEIILENVILFDFKKIDAVQTGKYVLFESPVNGVNKYNLGKIVSIDEVEDEQLEIKQLKIGINCKYDPDLIPTNIAEHFKIGRIDQPIMGTIYMTVPKPRNYKNQ